MAEEQEKREEPQANVQVAPPEAKENIDQVRNLLFGPQIKNIEKRFTVLEQRFNKDIHDLKDDVQHKIDSLEEFMRNEFSSLIDRIENEKRDRLNGLKQTEGKLQNAVDDMDRKTQDLESTISKRAHELREQLMQQKNYLNNEMKRLFDQALDTLEATASQIRNEHVDRATLSSLFTETALRLNNDDLASSMLSNALGNDG